jgi:hypothetical protein
MAKSKPKPIAVKKVLDPARHARIRRALVHTACALLFVGALVVGFHFMRTVGRETRRVSRSRAEDCAEEPAGVDDGFPGEPDHGSRQTRWHALGV